MTYTWKLFREHRHATSLVYAYSATYVNFIDKFMKFFQVIWAFKNLLSFYLCVLPVCVFAHCVCAVSVKARRGHKIPWPYKQLWVAMWLLGIVSVSSGTKRKCFWPLSSLQAHKNIFKHWVINDLSIHLVYKSYFCVLKKKHLNYI